MEQLTINVQNDTYEEIKELVRSGEADNKSEAARMIINGNVKTQRRELWDRAGNMFAMIGIIGLGFTLFYPIGIRMLNIIPLVAAICCYSFGWTSEQLIKSRFSMD